MSRAQRQRHVNDADAAASPDSRLAGESRGKTRRLLSGHPRLKPGAHGLFGGDELLVILPATPSARATEVAERIRGAVEANVYPPDGIRATVSIGVATARQTDHLKSLVQLADRALYHAKEAGRNRVITASP